MRNGMLVVAMLAGYAGCGGEEPASGACYAATSNCRYVVTTSTCNITGARSGDTEALIGPTWQSCASMFTAPLSAEPAPQCATGGTVIACHKRRGLLRLPLNVAGSVTGTVEMAVYDQTQTDLIRCRYHGDVVCGVTISQQ